MSNLSIAILAFVIGVCVVEALTQPASSAGIRLKGWTAKCDKTAGAKKANSENDCFKSCQSGSGCMFVRYNSKTKTCGVQPANSDCSFDQTDDNMVILGESKRTASKVDNIEQKGSPIKTKAGAEITRSVPGMDFPKPIAEEDCKNICALTPKCKVAYIFFGRMVPQGLCSLYAKNTPGQSYKGNDRMGAKSYVFA